VTGLLDERRYGVSEGVRRRTLYPILLSEAVERFLELATVVQESTRSAEDSALAFPIGTSLEPLLILDCFMPAKDAKGNGWYRDRAMARFRLQVYEVNTWLPIESLGLLLDPDSARFQVDILPAQSQTLVDSHACRTKQPHGGEPTGPLRGYQQPFAVFCGKRRPPWTFESQWLHLRHWIPGNDLLVGCILQRLL